MFAIDRVKAVELRGASMRPLLWLVLLVGWLFGSMPAWADEDDEAPAAGAPAADDNPTDEPKPADEPKAADEPKHDEAKHDDANADDAKADDAKPDDAKADDAKPDDANADDAKAHADAHPATAPAG